MTPHEWAKSLRDVAAMHDKLAAAANTPLSTRKYHETSAAQLTSMAAQILNPSTPLGRLAAGR